MESETKKKVVCRQVFKCKEKECPAYNSEDVKCWLYSNTHCRNEIQGKFLDKLEMCLDCEVFKANMDVASVRETIEAISIQLKEAKEAVADRDRELKGMSLELALGLSEVFEALKQISLGDPSVRISESSEIELIAKLKQLTNATAAEIGKSIDQFHEFAIGLAEHFDVLHKVSRGERDARISESSQDELLQALGKVTNEMIDGVSREIAEREKVDEELRRTNDKLKTWVDELEQRNREISLLGEMANLLQSCLSADEAYSIISKAIHRIFPGDSGALCIFKESRNIVETVATWGDGLIGEQIFAPEDCWALRRGQAHVVENHESGLLCRHVNRAQVSYMCVPMQAHGEMLGMLHLQNNRQTTSRQKAIEEYLTESKQQLAKTVAEQIALALANLKLKETLRVQSIRDPLTGLFNRRYMEESLQREVRRVSRKQSSLGVIMLDIDHFKHYNDTFGHAAGDAVLRELGIFLRANLRGEDIACRYGGEEFAIILPEASLEITRERAEKLREGVKHVHVQYLGQSSGPVTISLGVAVFPLHGSTGELAIQAADAALYRAKAEGRDRVAMVGEYAETRQVSKEKDGPRDREE